jgi:hypothetical protein
MREDTMVLEIGTALVQVQKRAVNKLRPLIWRQMITPTSGINPAVEYIETQKRVDFAEIRPIGPQDQVYPLASEEKSSRRVTVHEFGAGFRLMDDERERAALTGDTPGVNRMSAIMRKSEELLDRIAAVGYSDLGLYGMLNQPDVTPVTINGDWLAASPSPANMLADLNEVLDAVRVQTDEVSEGTGMVLPPAAYRAASRTIFQSNSPDTVLQVFQRQNPNVQLFQWTHATTAGTDGRIMAWVRGDSDVFEMYVPRMLTADQPIRIKRGYEQALYMKTGGVYSLFPQGIAYGDGVLGT